MEDYFHSNGSLLYCVWKIKTRTTWDLLLLLLTLKRSISLRWKVQLVISQNGRKGSFLSHNNSHRHGVQKLEIGAEVQEGWRRIACRKQLCNPPSSNCFKLYVASSASSSWIISNKDFITKIDFVSTKPLASEGYWQGGIQTSKAAREEWSFESGTEHNKEKKRIQHGHCTVWSVYRKIGIVLDLVQDL